MMRNIYIGENLLESRLLINHLQAMALRVAILTDTTVEALYGQKLLKTLQEHGLQADIFSISPGEVSKSRKTKEWLEDQLLEKKYGRDTCILALGGGVVCDLAGFVASTYCRGVSLVMLPTTLLAMVDAAIGGKTGVNVPSGKNMIGTIYRPHALFMDTATLKTLPEAELKNGLVECMKHGLILDYEYFVFLETHHQAVINLDPSILETLIAKSCRIKNDVVEEDEYERGKRRLLNFGHTVGHALEVLTNYTIAHGRAVAIGIIAESYLSVQLGHLSRQSFERIVQIFTLYGIDTTLECTFTPKDFLETMKMDKKAFASAPRFVVIDEIGHCLPCAQEYCQVVPENMLQFTVRKP